LAKRNNYQQEKRSKELDRLKKKEAKKERKLNRERQESESPGIEGEEAATSEEIDNTL
jgi:hypothetical protein